MHAVADNATRTNEGIKRSDILAEDKIQAEGAAEEVKICLGLILDT